MGNSSSAHHHEPLDHHGFQRGTYGDTINTKSASFRQSKKSPRKMDRLRRSFRDSFRRRKDRLPESSKPHQWQSDEQAVRSATCSFPVKYLGCVEVYESRGMQVCEEALKVLRNSRRRPVRGLLHVSGDGLRVVDDETKGLIVDQTIEKVSFCAPDRNHERGFSYICRDGTTRRWMCHGFLASKDSGERLSHAVGCAFAVCLERKQRRDKECGVTMTFDMKNSTFTRSGSFRQQTMTERMLANERSVDVPQPSIATVTPQPKPFNPFAIERPHATPSMLERQGSFRGLGTLGTTSPFKRQMSLRLNDLPSNAERQRAFLELTAPKLHNRSVSPIPEVMPIANGGETVSQLCQEMSQELSLLAKDDLNFGRLDANTISLLQSAPTSPVAGSGGATNVERMTQMMTMYTNPVLNGGGNITTTYSTVTTVEQQMNTLNQHNQKMVMQSPTGGGGGENGMLMHHRLPATNGILTTTTTGTMHGNGVGGVGGGVMSQGGGSTTTTAIVSPSMVTTSGGVGGGPAVAADQWLLAQMMNNNNNNSVTTTSSSTPTSSPTKRAGAGVATAVAGQSARIINKVDPFDAEWVAPIVHTDGIAVGHNTNPFISPPPPTLPSAAAPAVPAQQFQVQL